MKAAPYQVCHFVVYPLERNIFSWIDKLFLESFDLACHIFQVLINFRIKFILYKFLHESGTDFHLLIPCIYHNIIQFHLDPNSKCENLYSSLFRYKCQLNSKSYSVHSELQNCYYLSGLCCYFESSDNHNGHIILFQLFIHLFHLFNFILFIHLNPLIMYLQVMLMKGHFEE